MHMLVVTLPSLWVCFLPDVLVIRDGTRYASAILANILMKVVSAYVVVVQSAWHLDSVCWTVNCVAYGCDATIMQQCGMHVLDHVACMYLITQPSGSFESKCGMSGAL